MTGACTCTATITDPERAARFADIFPNDRIPIRYPLLAGKARVVRNDSPETFDFYEVAIERFTPEQKRKVAEAVAAAGFRNVTAEEAQKDMDDPKMVIPLKADSVITSWCELHMRAAL